MIEVKETRIRVFRGLDSDKAKIWEKATTFTESFSPEYELIKVTNSDLWGVLRDDFVVAVAYSVSAQALENEDERRD